MYGCESWTIKKAECQKIDAFKLRCWRRLLRVLWTARRSNQSILKEVSPEYSLERLTEAETPILWPPDETHWKRPWCWERFKAGGEGDRRGWGGWMASPTQWTWVWVNSGSWWWTGRPGVLQSVGLRRVGHDWVTEMNWIEEVLPDQVPGQHLFFTGCSGQPVCAELSISLWGPCCFFSEICPQSSPPRFAYWFFVVLVLFWFISLAGGIWKKI